MCKDIKYLQRVGLAPHKNETRAQKQRFQLLSTTHLDKPSAFQLLAEQIQ